VRPFPGLIPISCLLLLTGAARAVDYSAGPEDYRDYLSRLVPGDRLLLQAGDYTRGLPLRGLEGSTGQAIVIEGPPQDPRARFLARPGANTVSLVNVRHVSLRNLELDGRNLPVDAVKAEGHAHFAHYVTLENLHIHDHAASQQNVGISTKCPAFGWVVRGNRIERVGTGMYFGDSDGSDPFVAGVIEDNRVTGTLGYNLQIKHQKARPADLPESGVRHDTVIRRNFFSRESAVPGASARPNVLVGHFPVAGEGSEDRYLIHGNLFWHNPSEALIQAEGRVALYDNVFINDSGDAIRIQPHNDVPRDMTIFSNTVLASGVGIRVRQADGAAYRQRVIANVVAAATPLLGGEAAANVTLPYQPGLPGNTLAELTTRLLALSPQAPRLDAALARELATFPGWRPGTRPGATLDPAVPRVPEARP
jgi:hypothetical protein